MNLTGAIVLYAVIWFLTFYIVLPIKLRKTQGEAGEIVPGTPAGAPAREEVGKSALTTTLFATVIWAVLAGIILSGWISIEDIDFMNVLGEPPAGG